MHLVISAHFSSFGWYIIPVRHFLQKKLSENPRIDFPILPTTKPCPLLPLAHGPPCLYWLGTSGWCLSLVHAPFSCKSMVCLPFICLPLLMSLSSLAMCFCCLFLTFCSVGEFGSLSFAFHFLPGLGLAWARALSSLIWPLFLFIAGLWAN